MSIYRMTFRYRFLSNDYAGMLKTAYFQDLSGIETENTTHIILFLIPSSFVSIVYLYYYVFGSIVTIKNGNHQRELPTGLFLCFQLS